MEEEMKNRIVYYFIGVVISAMALTSVASLSSHAHKADNTLMATQAQLEALQKQHDQLKADHESLSKEYDQARSDLEAANDKVSALEGELKTAKEQNDALAQTIEKARLNMNVLDGLFNDSTSLQEMQARIAATGNSQLSKKWDAVNNQESLGSFIIYLVHTASESLN